MAVSVLFSEPKIPQLGVTRTGLATGVCFSALQRAENSSICGRGVARRGADRVSVLFSEPKIPQCVARSTTGTQVERFSALQRAENSSIERVLPKIFEPDGFSALQRAENSSIVLHTVGVFPKVEVSVLFSEPKIPQLTRSATTTSHSTLVSVLFSEPKIPQSTGTPPFPKRPPVSVLFSEPKIPQFTAATEAATAGVRFSALQRAENSSIRSGCASPRACRTRFSALQRAENSSIPTLAPASIHIPDCDDHASSFLSLPGASP